MSGHVIETYSGKLISLLDPQPEDIDIKDIAISLARICRFNGHCNHFYSVATHSVYTACVVDEHLGDLMTIYAALLHDAGEAYYGDVTTPVKRLLGPAWKELNERFDRVIADKFGIVWTEERKRVVKYADQVAGSSEARDLMCSEGSHWLVRAEPHPLPIQPAPPAGGYHAFMDAFKILKGEV
jgi:5'-deoxynucleotidase YfbR-like HD superfamily hydrolase